MPLVRAVPMLRPRRTPDYISDADTLRLAPEITHPALPRCDGQQLALLVRVPVRARRGGEVHVDHAKGLRGGGGRDHEVDVDGAAGKGFEGGGRVDAGLRRAGVAGDGHGGVRGRSGHFWRWCWY